MCSSVYAILLPAIYAPLIDRVARFTSDDREAGVNFEFLQQHGWVGIVAWLFYKLIDRGFELRVPPKKR